MSDQLYIGVGCLEAQWLPFAVLRYTIFKHTKASVNVEPLYRSGIPVPVPIDPRNRQKTPFSFQRFLIPEIRGYRGRAVYMDSDMLVFDDIRALFDREFVDANVLAVPHETSVLLLDCEHLSWKIMDLVTDLDAGKLSYDGLMTCRAVARIQYALPKCWNWLDNSHGSPPPDVALVHFTVTSSQPWLTCGHQLGHLWLQALFAAIDDGAISTVDVEESVKSGFVRPSLLYQVSQRVTAKEDIPKSVLAEDAPFAEYCRYVHYSIVEGFRR